MRLRRRKELDDPQRKPRRVSYKSNRRFTLWHKHKMVMLRFGNLSNFRFKVRTYSEVADTMKCWAADVFNVI